MDGQTRQLAYKQAQLGKVTLRVCTADRLTSQKSMRSA